MPDGGAAADGGLAPDGGAAVDAGLPADAGLVTLPACPAGGTPVTGTSMTTYVTVAGDGGLTDVPNDLSQADIAALVPAAVDGGFCISPGTGTTTGTFTIPNVPSGTYYLKYNTDSYTSYLVTASRSIDLGSDTLGRPDAVEATHRTDLSFNVTGLAPWEAGEELQLFAANVAAAIFSLQVFLSPPLAGGEVTLSGTLDYREAVLPSSIPAKLIDASRDDEALVYQLVNRTGQGGVTYAALGKVFAPSPFTQHDGQSTSLSGAFTEVPQSQSISINWKRSMFEALRTLVNPNATSYGQALYLSAVPGGLSRGNYSNTADLVIVQPALGTTDLDLGTITFGNPFPASWGLAGDARGWFSRSLGRC